MRDFVEEQRGARDVVDIGALEHRLGHAREVGEFVDHAAQVADLADDRVGQPREGVGVARHFGAIAALEALGGELDRGQRVLDLVRDALGDVGPGGAALVAQLVGDVVEGQHPAVGGLHALDRERALPALGAHRDRRRRATRRRGIRPARATTSSRSRPSRLSLAVVEQRLGRAIDQQDAALGVERDDPRRDRRQHRLDERAARVELVVGGDQRPGLFLQPPGHAVEGGGEHGDLVGRLVDRDARRKVALLDPSRGIDQLVDRAQQAVGQLERGEDRQRDDDQRAGQQGEVEAQLVEPAARQQVAIVGQDVIAAADLLAEPRIEHARGVDEGRRAIIEPRQRADPVGRIDLRRLRLPRSSAILAAVIDLVERAVVGIDQRQRPDLAVGAKVKMIASDRLRLIDLAEAEGVDEARVVDRDLAGDSRRDRCSSSTVSLCDADRLHCRSCCAPARRYSRACCGRGRKTRIRAPTGAGTRRRSPPARSAPRR